MRKYLYFVVAAWIIGFPVTLHQASIPSPAQAKPIFPGQATSDSISFSNVFSSAFGFLLNKSPSPNMGKDIESEVNPVYFLFSHQIPESITQEAAFSFTPQRITLALDKGDTLLKVLMDAEVSQRDAQIAIDALKDVYDPRQLREGQEVAVMFGGQSNSEFMGLELHPSQISSVSVARDSSGAFKATETNTPVERKLVAAQATIFSNLFEAGSDAGIPISVMSQMLKVYSYNVDFQRDIHSGDTFRVIFEQDFTSDGKAIREGNIVYASMTLNGREMPLYRFEMPDGTVDMFDQKGSSIRKALMRTPVDGARMTSGFGMRRHPILGYSKMHAGVDFGASIGTPIYAAGDGVIDEIGGKGSYGNYIRLKHTSMISTAYAHISRFAKNMRRGTRVKQGEVIAYVGTTGRSTGPHLHYEVLRSGRAVNPLSVDMPSGKVIDKKLLPVFEARVKEIEALFANIGTGQVQLANLRTEGGVSSPQCDQSHTC